MLTAMIMSIAYGYEVEKMDDVYVANAHELNQTALAVAFSPAGIINFFPSRASLPILAIELAKLSDALLFCHSEVPAFMVSRHAKDEPHPAYHAAHSGNCRCSIRIR